MILNQIVSRYTETTISLGIWIKQQIHSSPFSLISLQSETRKHTQVLSTSSSKTRKVQSSFQFSFVSSSVHDDNSRAPQKVCINWSLEKKTKLIFQFISCSCIYKLINRLFCEDEKTTERRAREIESSFQFKYNSIQSILCLLFQSS